MCKIFMFDDVNEFSPRPAIGLHVSPEYGLLCHREIESGGEWGHCEENNCGRERERERRCSPHDTFVIITPAWSSSTKPDEDSKSLS